MKSTKTGEASPTAIAYVQLVYGRQLQQPADEAPNQADSLDVASMTRDEREALKRRLMSPEQVETLRGGA